MNEVNLYAFTYTPDKSGNEFGKITVLTRYYTGDLSLTNQFKDTFHSKWEQYIQHQNQMQYFAREVYTNYRETKIYCTSPI